MRHVPAETHFAVRRGEVVLWNLLTATFAFNAKVLEDCHASPVMETCNRMHHVHQSGMQHCSYLTMISGHRIPLYYELKLALIIWLINPGTRGAEVLYDKYIWKLLREYASKWDPTFKASNDVRSNLQITLYAGYSIQNAGTVLRSI